MQFNRGTFVQRFPGRVVGSKNERLISLVSHVLGFEVSGPTRPDQKMLGPAANRTSPPTVDVMSSAGLADKLTLGGPKYPPEKSSRLKRRKRNLVSNWQEQPFFFLIKIH
jgi:hypothetical protein